MPSRFRSLIQAVLVITATAVIALGQTAPLNPPKPASEPSGQTNVLQVSTRLVTVDVVAVDSHHHAIRDLTAGDFEVSDGGSQKIEKFAFIDKSFAAISKGASTPPAKGSYDNQNGAASLTAPPTVVLIDSLNTKTTDLVQTRAHMLAMLKTLPSDTPVAVLLLGSSLSMVQDFTTDPSLLHAAIQKASTSPSNITAQPQDDPNSLALAALDTNDGIENEQTELLEDFEKETYANQMDIRVTTTVDALKAIARYLSAYQGRKNLVWVSESFPFALWPDLDFGTAAGGANFQQVFAGSREYADQVEEATNALTTARIAVYPVDARGLDTSQVFAASSAMPTRPRSASRSISAQLRRENTARTMSQSTMDELAETTGGKTCENTNDLSGCVESAFNDSSSYYELAYEPAGAKWDGRFREISLKVNRSGVKLSYRRGYYAQDEQLFATRETPEQHLREACQDFLPSTAIAIAAQAVPPRVPDEARYEITIKPGALAFSSIGEAYKVSAELASCVYDAAGQSFQMTTHDLTKIMSGEEFASFRAMGLRGPADFFPAATTRVRIAVFDETSGVVGALDIPVPKADSAPFVSAAAGAPNSSPSDESGYSVAFHLTTGESARLDWDGGKLAYTGNIATDKTAPALFRQFYTSKGFHCSAGALVPDDPAALTPTLRLVFTDSSGRSLIVDLKGDHPQYSGALPVDPSAQPFFDRLWYLTHCESAP